LSSLALSTF